MAMETLMWIVGCSVPPHLAPFSCALVWIQPGLQESPAGVAVLHMARPMFRQIRHRHFVSPLAFDNCILIHNSALWSMPNTIYISLHNYLLYLLYLTVFILTLTYVWESNLPTHARLCPVPSMHSKFCARPAGLWVVEPSWTGSKEWQLG